MGQNAVSQLVGSKTNETALAAAKQQRFRHGTAEHNVKGLRNKHCPPRVLGFRFQLFG